MAAGAAVVAMIFFMGNSSSYEICPHSTTLFPKGQPPPPDGLTGWRITVRSFSGAVRRGSPR